MNIITRRIFITALSLTFLLLLLYIMNRTGSSPPPKRTVIPPENQQQQPQFKERSKPIEHDFLLRPHEGEFSHVPAFWLFPNGETRGLVALFHGCTHGGESWFLLPEHVAVTESLIKNSFAVVAFSSYDRVGSKCWDVDYDPTLIDTALTQFIGKYESKFPISKIYGLGASSGGNFVSMLPNLFHFFRAIAVYISPGSFEHLSDNFPATMFIYMPRDKRFGSERNVQDSVRYLKGHGIETDVVECKEQPLTITTFKERMSLNVEDSRRVHEIFREERLLNEDGTLRMDPKQGGWESKLFAAFPFLKAKRRAVTEVLAALYAEHEMTRDHSDRVVQWFLDH
eukprot:TRINITY_DN12857_c0_g1_i1.p1 TRINITY_DN12857_c0_g1~~TRINITY_DN12857_c0_g1_i1.p1  ORF type:complete len:360 (+),score=30.25 TRINITY_DN12857_c0_g1_i1:63-1082(+)